MENQMLSLYDYLGRAAGTDLGRQVYQIANSKKIKVDVKEVSNPAYSGKVLMYPKSFLDNYFQAEQVDDLPF
jgi:hypothetical protein